MANTDLLLTFFLVEGDPHEVVIAYFMACSVKRPREAKDPTREAKKPGKLADKRLTFQVQERIGGLRHLILFVTKTIRNITICCYAYHIESNASKCDAYYHCTDDQNIQKWRRPKVLKYVHYLLKGMTPVSPTNISKAVWLYSSSFDLMDGRLPRLFN